MIPKKTGIKILLIKVVFNIVVLILLISHKSLEHSFLVRVFGSQLVSSRGYCSHCERFNSYD